MPSLAGIYYYQYQSGELESLPVLLVHGAGGTHLDWPAAIRRLEGVRTFALDLPGHGKSAGSGHQTIEGYGRILANWLESLHISRAAVVGHSMGGAVAMSMALSFPEKVAALGLIATGAKLTVLSKMLEDSASPSNYHKAIRALIERYFSPQTAPGVIEQVETRLKSTRHSVLQGDLTACNFFDVINNLREIECPTLVVCGSADRLTPVRYSQFLAAEISGAQIDTIPGAAHMVMIEAADKTAAVLTSFFNRLNYQAGD